MNLFSLSHFNRYKQRAQGGGRGGGSVMLWAIGDNGTM